MGLSVKSEYAIYLQNHQGKIILNVWSVVIGLMRELGKNVLRETDPRMEGVGVSRHRTPAEIKHLDDPRAKFTNSWTALKTALPKIPRRIAKNRLLFRPSRDI